MTDADIRQQVDAFVALPRAERREKFASLPKEVKVRARKVIEARRGIAYRADGGMIVYTKDHYINNILRMQNKKDVVLPKRITKLETKMVELKRQLQENYGDEALAEVETALEEQASAAK